MRYGAAVGELDFLGVGSVLPDRIVKRNLS